MRALQDGSLLESPRFLVGYFQAAALLQMASFLESMLLRKQPEEREAVRIYNLIMALLQDADVSETRATVELCNDGTPMAIHNEATANSARRNTGLAQLKCASRPVVIHETGGALLSDIMGASLR